jgi:hypothetical protein
VGVGYVVKDEGPDGEITLVPDTSADAILDRLGHTRATLAEFEAEYGEEIIRGELRPDLLRD